MVVDASSDVHTVNLAGLDSNVLAFKGGSEGGQVGLGEFVNLLLVTTQAVASIEDRARVSALGDVTHVLPLSVSAFALAGTSLVGLPPSGGFAAKWLLLDAGIGAGAWGWVALILLGSLLAAAYVMRFVGQAFVRADVLPAARPVPATMEWTALGLALASALLGLVAGWPLGLLQAAGPAGVAS